MFSPAKNDADETDPNVNVHPVDMAHPGTLPTINRKAVEHMIRIGLSVGGEIADFTEFDRKNYFYPDIPKGYQISQFAYPIVSGGELHGVELTRIHLEEDTGTSKHDQGDFSLVDYNRAGVPLMELVTEPVIHSAEQAVAFAKQLQLLLRYLGAGHANMEKGEMRVEANISVSDTDELGTKVEIKNLNSFKVVEKAIAYEIARMTKLREAGKGDEIVQETRGWDEEKGKTFSQRVKETSDDYRFFPEPDLPKMKLHEVFDLNALKESLPELPWEKRMRIIEQFDISDNAADFFIIDIELGNYFDAVVKENGDTKFAKLAGNYISSDVVSLLKEQEGSTLPSPMHFSKLIDMIMEDTISSRGAKDTLALMMRDDGDPESIADSHGLLQQSDTGAIEMMVDEVIADNVQAVEEYKAGKEASLQYLIGQGMRLSKGSANPQVLKEVFVRKLG
jgi:aspartyl-tRNA(Asn)/glutamyl-tRNA(Gln) amidotransferase subunit B